MNDNIRLVVYAYNGNILLNIKITKDEQAKIEKAWVENNEGVKIKNENKVFLLPLREYLIEFIEG